MRYDTKTFYVLRCLQCDDDSDMTLDIPFPTAAARGRWAADHRDGTGHDRWFVTEVHRPIIPDSIKVVPLDPDGTPARPLTHPRMTAVDD